MISTATPTLRPSSYLRTRVILPLALLFAALVPLALSWPAGAAPADLGVRAYPIAPAMAQLYLGRYQLRRVTHGAPLDCGTIVLTLNTQGHLQGLMEALGNDAHGWRTSWVVDLANFRLSPARQLSGDILGQGFTIRLGRLTLSRAWNGDLTGQITLGQAAYATQWHKLTTAQS